MGFLEGLFGRKEQPKQEAKIAPKESSPDARPWEPAVVSKYLSGRNYGFVVRDAGGDDLFVHQTTLARCGLATLTDGQKVDVRWGKSPTKPGKFEVTDIRAK